MTTDRFNLAAERRSIEVERASPVRVVARIAPVGFYDIRCGNCGVILTWLDSSSGLVSMYGWSAEGWTWQHQRRRKHRRLERGIEESEYPAWQAAFDQGDRTVIRPRIIRLSPRGQVAVDVWWPVSEQNHWQRPDLPELLRCYRCQQLSGFSIARLRSIIQNL